MIDYAAKTTRSLMTSNPVTLDPEAELDDALSMFESYRFRHLPVVSSNRLLGILSDRDLRLATSLLPARRRLKADHGEPVPGPRRVEEVMTTQVTCLSPEDTLATAAREMVDLRIGAIPIIEDGQLRGILTETDLLEAYAELCRVTRGACDDVVRYHMGHSLAHISPDTSVEEALEALEPGADHLAVVENGQMVGFLSQRDLFVGIARESIEDARAQAMGANRDVTRPVSEFMTRQVLHGTPDQSLREASRSMIRFRVSCLPIIEEGQDVGVLSQRHILVHFASVVSA